LDEVRDVWKATIGVAIGFVMGAILFGQAQTEAPRNLAGAEFPCTYTAPQAHKMTADFVETVNEVTFATGFQIESGTITLRATNARCDAGAECELTGKVTVKMTAPKIISK
jgi:hypothetical protein